MIRCDTWTWTICAICMQRIHISLQSSPTGFEKGMSNKQRSVCSPEFLMAKNMRKKSLMAKNDYNNPVFSE